MVRPLALAAAVCLVASSAPAEIAPAKSKPKATKKAPKNPPADAAQPTASAKTGEGGTPAGASQRTGFGTGVAARTEGQARNDPRRGGVL